MSTRDDYTQDEWFLLSSTPGVIGAAVMAAGASGPFGTVQETVAFARGVASGAKAPGGTELIDALTARLDRQKDEAYLGEMQARAKSKRDRLVEAEDSPAFLREEALADARAVSDLLASKATPEEADAYRRWMMDLARAVAESAKEGSVLGFGGERVSAEEEAVLADLEGALRGSGPAA